MATEREGEREHENPLPDGAWVELTTQFDDADDERGRFLAARRRPYDAVESEIAPVRPVFPSSPGEAFTAYLDGLPPLTGGAEIPEPSRELHRPIVQPVGVDPGRALVAACRRLAAEEPALFACVLLCGLKGRSERAAAAELGIANGLVNRRKWAGMAQLVVWSRQPERAVIAWLDALRRMWTARETGVADATGGTDV